MALRADSDLIVTPATGKPPKAFKFEAMILDATAPSPTKVRIGLHLSDGNELTFTGGTKSITRDETIGKTAKRVTFSTNVNGNATGVAAFKVSMRDAAGRDLVIKMVRTS